MKGTSYISTESILRKRSLLVKKGTVGLLGQDSRELVLGRLGS